MEKIRYSVKYPKTPTDREKELIKLYEKVAEALKSIPSADDIHKEVDENSKS